VRLLLSDSLSNSPVPPADQLISAQSTYVDTNELVPLSCSISDLCLERAFSLLARFLRSLQLIPSVAQLFLELGHFGFGVPEGLL